MLTTQGESILEAINHTASQRNLQTAAALGDAAIDELRARLDDLRQALRKSSASRPAAAGT